MEKASWQHYLGLVIRPSKGLWNVLGIGVPGAASLALWATHNPLWAAGIAAVLFIALLAWAGYRLQRELDQSKRRRWVLESLGRQLTMGRFLLDSIEYGSDKFERALASWRSEGLTPEEMVERWDQFDDRDRRQVREWQQGVGDILDKRFDYSYRARFESDAGLTPAQPPDKLSDLYTRRWREHEFRLQRLHQIIEEESRRGRTE